MRLQLAVFPPYERKLGQSPLGLATGGRDRRARPGPAAEHAGAVDRAMDRRVQPLGWECPGTGLVEQALVVLAVCSRGRVGW